MAIRVPSWIAGTATRVWTVVSCILRCGDHYLHRNRTLLAGVLAKGGALIGAKALLQQAEIENATLTRVVAAGLLQSVTELRKVVERLLLVDDRGQLLHAPAVPGQPLGTDGGWAEGGRDNIAKQGGLRRRTQPQSRCPGQAQLQDPLGRL